jgi:hypothetical protein
MATMPPRHQADSAVPCHLVFAHRADWQDFAGTFTRALSMM